MLQCLLNLVCAQALDGLEIHTSAAASLSEPSYLTRLLTKLLMLSGVSGSISDHGLGA